jgi:hypothetical protein
MDLMKSLVSLVVCSGAVLCAADLSGVRNVYVMPMARGLDQYLASNLASHGVFQVVTDPKLADAVLSDRVGDLLQLQLENIFPTPKPEDEEDTEPAAKPDAKGDIKTEKSASPKADKGSQDQSIMAALSATSNKLDSPSQNSSFGRGKGTIFLVDAKSRQVIWSTYDPPRNTASHELDRTASNIVSRIRKDLKKATK